MLEEHLQQRLCVSVVCAEVSGVRAVLLDPLRNMLKNVSLRAGNADIGCRVGSGLHLELHAELFACLFHDRDAAAHGLIGHVTREGDVYECIAAQLVCCADHQIAASHEVVVDDEVCCGTDLGKILVGLTCDADDVRSLLLDAAERLSSSGNCLVDNDRLHLGIIGQVHDRLDRGLLLLGEVVGIDCQGDILFAVLRLESFRAASVVLRLGDRTGNDTDVEIFAGRFCFSAFCRSLSVFCGSLSVFCGSLSLFLRIGALNRSTAASAASCQRESHNCAKYDAHDSLFHNFLLKLKDFEHDSIIHLRAALVKLQRVKFYHFLINIIKFHNIFD